MKKIVADFIKKYWNKKNIIAFGIIYLCMLVMGFVYLIATAPYHFEGKYKEINPQDYISEWHETEAVGSQICMVEDAEDPYIVFDFGAFQKEVYGVKIQFSKEIKSGKVYFQTPNHVFTKDNVHEVANLNEIAFYSDRVCMPFRLDVDEDYTIEKMEIIDSPVNHSVPELGKTICMMVINLFLSIAVLFMLYPLIELMGVPKIRSFFKSRERIWDVLGFICWILLSLLVNFIYQSVNGLAERNPLSIYIILPVTAVLVFSVRYYKSLYQHAQILFFITSFLLGVSNIMISPLELGISSDDEMHYEKTAFLANGMNGTMRNEDDFLLTYFGIDDECFTRQGRIDRQADLEERLTNTCKELVPTRWKIKTKIELAPYLPGAFGLCLGRALDLEFHNIFRLGKFMNVLCYTLIMALAIGLLKKGRMLALTLGLIPTGIFLMSEYSYDWWLTCFITLGYCLLLSYLQQGKKITIAALTRIVALLVIGMIPKPVYLTLLIPLLFLKKEQVEQIAAIRAIAVVGMVILASIFLMPMFSGTFESDARGGDDVDAYRQLAYIFSHPLRYTKTLLCFLFHYLRPQEAIGYTTLFAYLGFGQGSSSVLMCMTAAAILDNGKEKQIHNFNPFYRLVTFLSALLTVAVVATSLYLLYNNVGIDWINGCQSRYLLPILFPLIYSLGESRIQVTAKGKNIALMVIPLVLSFIFAWNMNVYVVMKY